MRKEGNNPYNNKIIVDYEKKTIHFTPIGRKSIKKYYFIFFFTILLLYIILFYILLILICILEIMLGLKLEALLLWDFLALLSGTFAFSLYYFNKKWRKKYFPELSAKLIKFLRKITFKKNHKLVLEPRAIINNKFIIPEFSNVELKYNTTGDYSKYLKRITIMNIIKAYPFKWNCVFEFSQKPVKGKMEIEYT